MNSEQSINFNDVHYGQYVVPHHNEFVKLNVGQPSPEMLPLEKINDAMIDIGSKLKNKLSLQYGDIKGYKEFRLDLSKFLELEFHEPVNSEHLFITNGVTNGLYMLITLLSDKDSIFFVEEPTYFLGLQMIKDLKLESRTINMQEDGLDVDKFEQELEKISPSKKVFLYTVPVFHNPTSITMSHEKRKKLVSLTKKFKNLHIFADEVYQFLYFDKKPLKSLVFYGGERIVSLNSFSKILAPSLRMGWIYTKSADIMSKLVNSGYMDSSGGNSPICQLIIHNCLIKDYLHEHILKCRDFLKKNCEVLSNAVNLYLSDYVEFKKPTGGYFLWLKLKKDQSKTLEKLYEKHKVSCLSGYKFSAVNGCNNYIRLSFSYYKNAGLTTGIRRLKNIFINLQRTRLLKIFVNGDRGKLGSKIKKLINESSKLSYTNLTNSDVIIDVTSSSGTTDLLKKLIKLEHFVPVVVGTTGHTSISKFYIDKYSKNAPIAVVPNFSKGMNEVLRIIKTLPDMFENKDIAIRETHHVHKTDSPSGSAKTICDTIKKYTKKNPSCVSHRIGDVIGEHQIILNGKNETIQISHNVKSRDVFAEGALECCHNILKLPLGLYDSSILEKKIE